MPVGRFIAGVGALIWDPDTQKYLLLKRAPTKDVGAGSWECVTGRVDQGESFEQAVHREVQEEIGLDLQIEIFIGTTHFFRGQLLPENELVGVIYGGTILGKPEVRIGEEHSEMRWVTREEAFEFLPETHWLRTVIDWAERIRTHLPEPLAKFYRARGFELQEENTYR